MNISIIVPTYNEISTIGSFLEQLDSLEGTAEILFADGGSTDGTVEKISVRYPVIRCPKGRASQMNAAAWQAGGEMLWFVHCDSRLPPDALEQIAQVAEDGAKFGCFHIAFDYRGPFMGCNTFFSNFRASYWRIAIGDQGIFVNRELFLRLGGFPELPIMEDYAFSRQMKRQGIALKLLSGTITTSGRRYQREFPLVTMARMFYLRCLYRAGANIEGIARRYRDIRRQP